MIQACGYFQTETKSVIFEQGNEITHTPNPLKRKLDDDFVGDMEQPANKKKATDTEKETQLVNSNDKEIGKI